MDHKRIMQRINESELVLWKNKQDWQALGQINQNKEKEDLN
jgi:hypothetical protein